MSKRCRFQENVSHIEFIRRRRKCFHEFTHVFEKTFPRLLKRKRFHHFVLNFEATFAKSFYSDRCWQNGKSFLHMLSDDVGCSRNVNGSTSMKLLRLLEIEDFECECDILVCIHTRISQRYWNIFYFPQCVYCMFFYSKIACEINKAFSLWHKALCFSSIFHASMYFVFDFLRHRILFSYFFYATVYLILIFAQYCVDLSFTSHICSCPGPSIKNFSHRSMENILMIISSNIAHTTHVNKLLHLAWGCPNLFSGNFLLGITLASA